MFKVYPENLRAFNLYKNFGYLVVGEKEGRMVMEKKL